MFSQSPGTGVVAVPSPLVSPPTESSLSEVKYIGTIFSCLFNCGRITNLRQELVKRNLEAILVTQPENRYYLSGFKGSNGYLFITRPEAQLGCGRLGVHIRQGDPEGQRAGAGSRRPPPSLQGARRGCSQSQVQGPQQEGSWGRCSRPSGRTRRKDRRALTPP